MKMIVEWLCFQALVESRVVEYSFLVQPCGGHSIQMLATGGAQSSKRERTPKLVSSWLKATSWLHS